MQKGPLSLATVSHTETFWRKVGPKRDGLGTGDGLHSWVLQEPVSTGDNPRECDSQGTSKDTLVREG